MSTHPANSTNSLALCVKSNLTCLLYLHGRLINSHSFIIKSSCMGLISFIPPSPFFLVAKRRRCCNGTGGKSSPLVSSEKLLKREKEKCAYLNLKLHHHHHHHHPELLLNLKVGSECSAKRIYFPPPNRHTHTLQLLSYSLPKEADLVHLLGRIGSTC